jgi:carboxymethylenebutenolidase
MALNWMQQYAATELVELADEGRMSRRDALGHLAKLVGGSAAAVAFLNACSSDGGSEGAGSTTSRPSSVSERPATTPPTGGGAGHALSVAADDPDVRASTVSFDGPASTIGAYLAVPASGAPAPGVVVIHEIFGLNDHIRDVARRLAKVGYHAIAPDLASRVGGTDATDDVIGALTGSPVEDRVADLRASADHLQQEPGVNGHLGVVGFCFGGAMTLSFAAADPKVEAAAPYYGSTPQPPSVMTGTKAAVLAHYGADDARVNAGIPDLEAAMQGSTFRKHVWPGVGHQFNNDTSPAYDEPTAVAAWKETLAWFDRYLR